MPRFLKPIERFLFCAKPPEITEEEFEEKLSKKANNTPASPNPSAFTISPDRRENFLVGEGAALLIPAGGFACLMLIQNCIDWVDYLFGAGFAAVSLYGGLILLHYYHGKFFVTETSLTYFLLGFKKEIRWNEITNVRRSSHPLCTNYTRTTLKTFHGKTLSIYDFYTALPLFARATLTQIPKEFLEPSALEVLEKIQKIPPEHWDPKVPKPKDLQLWGKEVITKEQAIGNPTEIANDKAQLENLAIRLIEPNLPKFTYYVDPKTKTASFVSHHFDIYQYLTAKFGLRFQDIHTAPSETP